MQTRCDDVAEALVAQGLHAVALHGGRTQTEREAALREFRKGTTNILVRLFVLISILFSFESCLNAWGAFRISISFYQIDYLAFRLPPMLHLVVWTSQELLMLSIWIFQRYIWL